MSANIICSKMQSFRERNSRKTVSFEEQIMSKDRFTRIFFRQIEAIGVYYPSNIRKARETELFTNSLWGFHKKKNCGPLIPNNEITSWSGGIDENWYRELLVGRLIPNNEITSWSGGIDENWCREIPLLSFISPPLRLHQIREHIKNTYLLKKLLSRVIDNCMNTSLRLVRKYAEFWFRLFTRKKKLKSILWAHSLPFRAFEWRTSESSKIRNCRLNFPP